jgi:hypothetical protein
MSLSSSVVLPPERPVAIPRWTPWLRGGRPAWRDWVRFATMAAQLGVLVLVIRFFVLGGERFGDVAVLAWAGFVIHHLLPLRFRLPFFGLLSIASIAIATDNFFAVEVVTAGLLLIGLCHLPVIFRTRVVLLLLVGCALAAARAGYLRRSPISMPALVVLGALFMFRLIVYLYDLRHRNAPFGFWRALAYFFMLPNAVFLLFPVVDYKTFCSTYYAGEPYAIYQRGLRWMLRGVLQLLLYRLVYQLMLIDPLDATNLGGVAGFMTATFLLYLKVSGTFHLAVGLLHLFGFALPEANHRYLLARSFLDLWRRINIYWKDFILKVFFNPAYFRLKGLGPTWALVLATLFAFFCTWLLHCYQTFWLRGKQTFSSWQEAVFWAVLGILVLGSVLFEARGGRRRVLSGARRTLRSELGRALSTVATLVTMIVLWTFWSSQSVDELLWLATAAQNVTPRSVAFILLGLVGIGVAAVIWGHSTAESGGVRTPTPPEQGLWFAWSAAQVGLACGCLFVVGALPGWRLLRETTLGDVLSALRADRFNQMDMEAVRRGYYEELDVVRRDDAMGAALKPQQWWPAREYHRTRRDHDFLVWEAIPGKVLHTRGRTITINRWGMRDHDYDKAKPPGVCRVVVLGSSIEAGHGVSDGESFPALLEKRLNEQDARATADRYEVLNFSVEGYGIYQKLELLHRSLEFDPDLVLFVTYLGEPGRTVHHLSDVWAMGCAIPEAYRGPIEKAFKDARVDRSMPKARVQRRLKPYTMDLIDAAFQHYAQTCRAHGVQPVIVYRPDVPESARLLAWQREPLLQSAEKAGLPVLSLSASYADVSDRESLMVSPSWSMDFLSLKRDALDEHPNEEAHRRLADELYRQLHTDDGLPLLRPK